MTNVDDLKKLIHFEFAFKKSDELWLVNRKGSDKLDLLSANAWNWHNYREATRKRIPYDNAKQAIKDGYIWRLQGKDVVSDKKIRKKHEEKTQEALGVKLSDEDKLKNYINKLIG